MKKVIGILAVLAIIIIGIVIYKNVRDARTYTADEWLEKQTEYVSQLEDIEDEYSTVLVLYNSGSITTDDFLNHVEDFQEELNLVILSRDNDLDEKPLLIKTYTYESKSGIEAIDSLLEIMGEMFADAIELSGDQDQLLYSKLAYNQEMTSCLNTFIEARIARFDYTDEEIEELQNEANKMNETEAESDAGSSDEVITGN